MEQLELEPAPAWDASTTGRGLTYYAMVQIPQFYMFSMNYLKLIVCLFMCMCVCKVGVLFQILVCGNPSFQTKFIGDYPFSRKYWQQVSQEKLVLDTWICLWDFYFPTVEYMSIFMPVPCWLCYCSSTA